MDLAHEYNFRKLSVPSYVVSILVLMDLAHESESTQIWGGIPRYVSILVLMDLAHELLN